MLDSPSLSGRADSSTRICAECGRQPRQDENAADEWRPYAGVDDELLVFCRAPPGRPEGTPIYAFPRMPTRSPGPIIVATGTLIRKEQSCLSGRGLCW